MYCRTSKMKCVRNNENETCKRCEAANVVCETRARQSGRRRTEPVEYHKTKKLTKAIEVLEDALKAGGGSANGGPSGGEGLQALLDGGKAALSFSQQQHPHQHPHHVSQFPNGPIGHSPHEHHHSGSSAAVTPVNQLINLPSTSTSSASDIPVVQLTTPTYGQPKNVFPMAPGDQHSPHNQIQHHPPTYPPQHAAPPPPPPLQHSHSHSHSDGVSNLLLLGGMPPSTTYTAHAHAHHPQPHPHSHPPPPHPPPTLRAQPQIDLPSAVAQEPPASTKFTHTPLEMLAERKPSEIPRLGTSSGRVVSTTYRPMNRTKMNAEVHHSSYFGDMLSIPSTLAYCEDFDPIVVGICTEKEAQEMFEMFNKNLQPMVALVDERIQGRQEVRERSTFLFVSILASASKFLEGYQATSQRLDQHLKTMLGHVLVEGGSSLELVQALCIICPWLDASPHFSLDQTSTYLNFANYKFHQIRRPTLQTDLPHEGKLHVRSYERTYLTLFCFDRGLALLHGHPWIFSIPENDLVQSVEQWANDPSAVPEDWTVAALVVIRRKLPHILRQVSNAPENTAFPTAQQMQVKPKSSPAVVKAITADFMTMWRNDWLPKSRTFSYLNLVGCHTQLSILIVVLKDHLGHPSESTMLHECLIAALQTCQAFVEAGEELRYLVNNTCMMIGYAATFALKLLLWKESSQPIEPNIYHLLRRVVTLLESFGVYPSHRFGRSKIYADRLNALLKESCSTRATSPNNQTNLYLDPLPEQDQSQTISGSANGALDEQQHRGQQDMPMPELSMDDLLVSMSDSNWMPLTGGEQIDQFVQNDIFGNFGLVQSVTWDPFFTFQ
ncbi:hypothetical protein BT69DRAFT_90951 [Atractiella rhizophila]|nr:hypothetical protein BT69DRAFT_90951 [Atractiella rhizophila]